MKQIKLTLEITEDLGVKGVVIDYNDTGLPENSKLINLIAIALLRGCSENREDLELQDLLNKVGIKRK